MAEGMQQAAKEHGPEAEAPAEGNGRLGPVDIDLRNNLRVCRGTVEELRCEVDRLRKIIQDYAAICQQSQQTIHDLEKRVGDRATGVKPVAWAVCNVLDRFTYRTYPTEIEASAVAEKLNEELDTNLYEVFRLSRIRASLTQEEREAIAVCAQAAANCGGFGEGPAIYQGDKVAATLDGLLKRLN